MHADAAGSTLTKKVARLVATPQAVDFGPVTAGFRYATSLQLTNVGTGACRYRVTQPPAGAAGSAPWLSISGPSQVLAPGMGVTLTLEIDGTQPMPGSPGSGITRAHEALIVAACDANRVEIPVTCQTTAAGRPASRQKPRVRLLGPSKLKYVPGSTKLWVPPPPREDDGEADEVDVSDDDE